MLSSSRACAQGADEKHLLASLRGVPSDDGAFRSCRVAIDGCCRRINQNANRGGGSENRRGDWKPRSAQVDVSIEEDGAYPYPAAVQILGQFTEMQRQNLARYIEENLAIGKEQQTWTNG